MSDYDDDFDDDYKSDDEHTCPKCGTITYEEGYCDDCSDYLSVICGY